MNPQDFRTRLRSGETLFGTMVTLPAAATAEVLVEVGFDWLFIDGEHGPLGTTEVNSILQAVSDKVACVVRVPVAAEVPIKQMLDLGAHGIIVPQVNSAAQAEQVVTWSKYAPLGARGVGLARAHGYGALMADYLATANDTTAVIVQAEHRTAVENIEDIVRVEGVDAIQLGPYDLSASFNKMGQIQDQEVTAAIDRVCAVCRGSNMPIGSFAVTPQATASDVERGATLLCAGTDTLFLARAAKEMLAAIRQQDQVAE